MTVQLRKPWAENGAKGNDTGCRILCYPKDESDIPMRHVLSEQLASVHLSAICIGLEGFESSLLSTAIKAYWSHLVSGWCKAIRVHRVPRLLHDLFLLCDAFAGEVIAEEHATDACRDKRDESRSHSYSNIDVLLERFDGFVLRLSCHQLPICRHIKTRC